MLSLFKIFGNTYKTLADWDKNDSRKKNGTSHDHDGKRWGKNGTRNGTHERNGTNDLESDYFGT